MWKIWQKDSSSLNKLVEDYTVGIDYLLDIELIAYDIKTSKAHAKMLHKLWLLEEDELNQLWNWLNEIMDLWKKWKFTIDKSQEDGHTAIETFLIEKYGEVWKKIHTWRSRNDQILVTMRLYTLEQLEEIKWIIKTLINSFNKKIEEIGDLKMPWYTHMQRAMPSTVAMWLESFKESLEDDLILLEAAKLINNQNPLGSVVWYGENSFWLDRDFTTELMWFRKTQSNSMYCAYSRGKFENIVLKVLWEIMLDLWKMANDLLLFTTKEFWFFDLPNEFKTWSSAMPQKKNWDIMEILRWNVGVYLGYQYQIQEIIKNLPSWYNRDFQLTKEPYLKAIKLLKDTINISDLVVQNLIANKESLEWACTDEIYATDKAYKLVKNGMSFRDAYIEVGKEYL